MSERVRGKENMKKGNRKRERDDETQQRKKKEKEEGREKVKQNQELYEGCKLNKKKRRNEAKKES